MGDHRPAYGLKAPGASVQTLRLPGQRSFPPLDEHLLHPEVTRHKITGTTDTGLLPRGGLGQ